MLSKRYQLLLLAVMLLAVFYPTNFSEFNNIDDCEMTTNLQNLGSWSLHGLFFPAEAHGQYYRPLLSLSFYLDKAFWSLNPSMMHLENVLLHLINALLVYTFSRNLLAENERQTSFAPLVAALVFALHPLAVEPVGWVSGRTDVLAATFVLLSAVALLKFKLEHKKFFGLLALVALVLAMLSKEVALGFVPGAFLLLIAKTPGKDAFTGATDKFWSRAKKIGVSLLLSGGALLIFFGFRSLAFTSNSSKIGLTIQIMLNDLYYTFFVFLRTFGFYLKKLYWPFPLNFAIVEIDPLYELLAIPLLLLCCWIVTRRTLISATFIAGLFFILPAMPIAFNQIAWTPYAERYLYVASAFIMIASVFYCREHLKGDHNPRAVTVGIVLLIIGMGVATFQRNMIMRTNLALYTDTVNKSPDFSYAWNLLGVAYYKQGDLKKAETHFRKALSMYRLYYDVIFDLNLAGVLTDQGKFDEAADIYTKIFTSGDKSARVMNHYEEFLQKRKAAMNRPGFSPPLEAVGRTQE